ncbi:hypothetical protein HELRODRAFT_179632 [Helobdella robusta]|uniref:MARVEL domain-containing protein n=1 Tax=Helobdella robusta TaxID=6412 RepID=T1FEY8_HELRO|nr:hypothetical protein HELRODRAFT_179632 [Helobdella robusta]ESN95287.1 hypothetical protein HELRODRAFT_179632 [Helobdella robusta]
MSGQDNNYPQPFPTTTTTYSQPQTTITSRHAPSDRYRSMSEMIDQQYLFSFYGIIKALQMIFDLSVFICASVNIHGTMAIISVCGYMQFVSMFTFIVSLVYYVIHMFRLDRTCPMTVPLKFTEFILSCFFTILYFISAILASVYIQESGRYNVNMAAAAFFTWSSVILYGADIIILWIDWRSSSEGPYFSSIITLPS